MRILNSHPGNSAPVEVLTQPWLPLNSLWVLFLTPTPEFLVTGFSEVSRPALVTVPPSRASGLAHALDAAGCVIIGTRGGVAPTELVLF